MRNMTKSDANNAVDALSVPADFSSEPPSFAASFNSVISEVNKCRVEVSDALFVARGNGHAGVYTNNVLANGVLQALDTQREECKQLCDVVLQVSGMQYYAHRSVLHVGSGYFRDFFSRQTSTNFPHHIAMPSALDSAVFGHVLRYMYTGNISVSLSSVDTLLHMSVTLGMPDVASACVTHMKTVLGDTTWPKILQLCDAFSLNDVTVDILRFAAMNCSHADLTWLPESHFHAVLRSRFEDADWSFRALLAWAVYDYENRSHLLDELVRDAVDVVHLANEDICRHVEEHTTHPIGTHPAVLQIMQQTTVPDKESSMEPVRTKADLDPVERLPIKKRESRVKLNTSTELDMPMHEMGTIPQKYCTPNEGKESAGDYEMDATRPPTAESAVCATTTHISVRLKSDACVGSSAALDSRCAVENKACSQRQANEVKKVTRSSGTARLKVPTPTDRNTIKREQTKRKKMQPQKLARTIRMTKKTADAPIVAGGKEHNAMATSCTQTTTTADDDNVVEWLIDEVKLRENMKRPRDKKTAGVAYPCDRCSRSFGTRSALSHHKRGHGSETAILCEICGFSTIHFASMNVHMRQHTDTKFKCPIGDCGYMTIRRSRLDDHMSAHAGIKNFICSQCGKAFTGRKHLQRHERIHAAVLEHACSDCEYRSSRRDKLREHVRRHHPLTAVAKGYMSTEEAAKVVLPRMKRQGVKTTGPDVTATDAMVPPTDAQMWPSSSSSTTTTLVVSGGGSLLTEDVMQYLASVTPLMGTLTDGTVAQTHVQQQLVQPQLSLYKQQQQQEIFHLHQAVQQQQQQQQPATGLPAPAMPQQYLQQKQQQQNVTNQGNWLLRQPLTLVSSTVTRAPSAPSASTTSAWMYPTDSAGSSTGHQQFAQQPAYYQQQPAQLSYSNAFASTPSLPQVT